MGIAALCAVTTTIAAASGSVAAMFTDMLLNRRKTGETEYDITMCMNGALSGLVGITAGCSMVEPWAAVIIGIIAGWTYIFWSNLLVMLKIDDAVDAIPVHFGNGIWGCIAVGIFAKKEFLEEEVGLDISHHKGAAYDLSAPAADVVEKYELSMSQRKIELPLSPPTPKAP